MACTITAQNLLKPPYLRMGAGHTIREALGILLDPQGRKEIPRILVVLNSDGSFVGLATAKDIIRSLLRGWVYEENRIEQTVLEKGFLVFLEDKLSLKISEATNRKAPVAAPTDSLPRLMRMMEQHRLECIAVIDKGRVAGLVHLADVFAAAANLALAAQPEEDNG